MHLPDGYLSDSVCLVTTVASFEPGRVHCWRANRASSGATANHCRGRDRYLCRADGQFSHRPRYVGSRFGRYAAAAIISGPSAAALCMSVVLALRCAALFADGGMTALGANVLNMAVIAPLVASLVYRAIVARSSSRSVLSVAAFVAAAASVIAAAMACSIELAVSGTQPLSTVFMPMLSVHALIGVAEGLITVALVVAMTRIGIVAPRTRTSVLLLRWPLRQSRRRCLLLLAHNRSMDWSVSPATWVSTAWRLPLGLASRKTTSCPASLGSFWQSLCPVCWA